MKQGDGERLKFDRKFHCFSHVRCFSLICLELRNENVLPIWLFLNVRAVASECSQ
jgi:hypothetical protein